MAHFVSRILIASLASSARLMFRKLGLVVIIFVPHHREMSVISSSLTY